MPMIDDGANASWRETGVGNWARDHGLVMTKEDGLYNLWSSDSFTCILGMVELDEVEDYLETL